MNARARAVGLCVVGMLVTLGVQSAMAQTIAITGGQVHTGTGEVIEGGTVILVDGRITAVGRDITIPQNARTVNAAGKIVTPGLFDVFTALGLVEVGLEQNTVDGSTNNDRVTAAFNVMDGINPFATSIPVTRIEGITRAIVAPRGSSGLIQGQGVYVNLAGRSAAQMVEQNPVAMFAVLGEAGARAAGGARGAATLLLREALDDARDYANNRQAYEAGQRRPYALSRLDLEALVPVVRGQLPLVVSANRASDILAALRIKQEYDIQLVIAGAVEGWMVASELEAADVPVIVTGLRNLPSFEGLGAAYENAGRLQVAGVDVMLSSFDAHNVRNLRQVAGMAVSYGLQHDAALAAVTRIPARVFGIDDYGTLEAGKRGDVVVWTGDPFEVTTWAERVYINGQEIPMESRQRLLFERYRSLDGMPR